MNQKPDDPPPTSGTEARPTRLERFVRSFVYAGAGVVHLFRTQQNFRVHLACGSLVVLLGLILGIERTDWALVTLAAGLVLTAEAFNTALERLADKVSRERDPLIGWCKDVGAGAVLLAAIAAAIVALLVYPLYLVRFISRFFPSLTS